MTSRTGELEVVYVDPAWARRVWWIVAGPTWPWWQTVLGWLLTAAIVVGVVRER